MITDLDRLAALADELCDPHQHTERVPYWDHNRHRQHREHRTIQPGLLTQLAELVADLNADTDPQGGRPIPGSRPPANIDALCAYTVITIAAQRWCWSLRLDLRNTPESNIRALVGAAGHLDDETLHTLVDEATSWRNTAAVLTGWRTPPYRPQVPCPACEHVGKLRINLNRQTAVCLAHDCHATWDAGTVGVLARYIRSATKGTAA